MPPEAPSLARRLRDVPDRIEQNLAAIRLYKTFSRKPIDSMRFLLFNRERDNYTYELENVDELAGMLGIALGCGQPRARQALQELEEDEKLRSDIELRLRNHGDRNRSVGYARRLGWYAIARLIGPRLIVETGIHDGLGSAVLLRALQRNAAEGSHGRLVAFDIRDDVGWLVDDELRNRYEVCIGDTRHTLARRLEQHESVDMFVHDSAHTYDHETFELETVLPHASPGAVLISDNAHAVPAFADFCERHDLPSWIFYERPFHHVYPGAALGLTLCGSARA